MIPRKYCPFTMGKTDPAHCVESECAVFVNDFHCRRGDNDKCEYEDECSKRCQYYTPGYCGLIPS